MNGATMPIYWKVLSIKKNFEMKKILQQWKVEFSQTNFSVLDFQLHSPEKDVNRIALIKLLLRLESNSKEKKVIILPVICCFLGVTHVFEETGLATDH